MSNLKHKYILCPDVLELISKNEELERENRINHINSTCFQKKCAELESQLADIAEFKDRLLNSTGDRPSVKTAICIAHEIDIILNREKAE
jgi:hypothetical protein